MPKKQQVVNQIAAVIEQGLAVAAPELRKRGLVYTFPLGEGMTGWIGLNVAVGRSDEQIGVNPVIGVRSEQIEGLLKQLGGEVRGRLAVTISTAVGYLMPEKRFLEWLFDQSPSSDHASEAKRIALAIEIYGIPFMRGTASLEALIDNLEHLRFSFKESAMYRLPVAYLLVNKLDSAVSYVNDQLRAMAGRQDGAALRYAEFARALLAKATLLAS
jgi:hypothetical protein